MNMSKTSRCKYVWLACALYWMAGSNTVQAENKATHDLLLPPPGKVLLGAFTTMEEADTQRRFKEYGQAAGKDPAIHLIFRDWTADGSSNFPIDFIRTSARLGAVPMLSWEPWFNYSQEDYPLLRDIAKGQHDAYITAFLQDAAKFGQPWFLRFAHEMEGSSYPWTKAHDSRQSPSDYAAAFVHIAQLARKIAPLTVMVWSPNSGSKRALQYYPGDEWVDWVGSSLYNFPDAPQAPDHKDKLTGWVDMLRKLDKPGMIAEMGCSEHYTISKELVQAKAPGTPKVQAWMDLTMADKSVCLERTFDIIEAEYPEIRALVWFDIDKDADWRIDSSPQALKTFARRAASPRYLGADSTNDVLEN
ncbi:glycoside hydrolase family 26 protein [Granulosicoccus antarcticus]|uniref:Endoglucanase H n=1 Tax=Granulosicoccus antarcticus IMCC3135 TaxID=1192854 RepID=A0A2Z2NI52_9GAMM|nr:glycosyl hydrolase [Granulosicoccus antarcticus]ASJ70996.1 Endoglucanase H [Granulosicoccus antarcticus IMCC3135]